MLSCRLAQVLRGKPPDEAMSLDLRVDGLVKAIACDQIANA
jgi:hypothetical protein